jgi:hypothetical protein
LGIIFVSLFYSVWGHRSSKFKMSTTRHKTRICLTMKMTILTKSLFKKLKTAFGFLNQN